MTLYYLHLLTRQHILYTLFLYTLFLYILFVEWFISKVIWNTSSDACSSSYIRTISLL
jgi:hypothetical protein